MERLKLNKHQVLSLLLIFALAVGLRAYRATGKDSLFTDENLSIVLSNYGHHGYAWPVVAVDDEVRTYEGRDLRNRIFNDDNSLKNIAYDLWNLRKGTRDTPHTNLYYSCLRLSFWGADTTDLSDVVRRAVFMNTLAFALGFLFLFRLCRILFRNNWTLILCALAIMAFNPVSVSNTIFMREYQLQETMFIILVYFAVSCAWRLYEKGILYEKKRSLVGLCVTTAIALLPGYFSVPFVLMIWGGLGLFAILNRSDVNKKKTVLQLVGTFTISIVLLFLIYPVYMDGFSGDRGEQAVGKLSVVTMIESLGEIMVALSDNIGLEILICLALSFALLIALLVKNRKNLTFQQIALSYILICAVVWVLFTFYLAPVKKIRYIASIFPLLYLVFPFVLSFLSVKKIQYAGVAVVLGFFVFKTATQKDNYWGKVDVGDNYRNDVETPLIIAGVYSPWLQTSLTPYFSDGRAITFVFGMEEFVEELNKHQTAYVILGGESLSTFSIPSNYVLAKEQVFDSSDVEGLKGRFKVKKISEKE